MFPKDFLSGKAKYGLNKIKEIEQKMNRDDLIYKVDKKKKKKGDDKKCDFQKFKPIRYWKRNL